MAPLPLQAMDYTSLQAVLAELGPQALPSRFEKAQQPDGHSLQLGLRTLERRLWIELSWLAEAPRLLAIAPPPRSGEGSTLAQQLQHGLGGLALVELHQPPWERCVELGFAPRPGEAIQRSLVLELMGRHSNLFLLDGERRVVAAARQVRDQQSRCRPIGTGDLYTPPPPQAGRPPDGFRDFERWRQELLLVPLPLRQALQSSFQAISPALALQLAGDSPGLAQALLDTPVTLLGPQQWQLLWRHWQAWLAALAQGHFQFSRGGASAYRCWGHAEPGSGADPMPINTALAAYHRQVLQGRALGQRHQQLEQRLQQALRREEEQRQQQRQLLGQGRGRVGVPLPTQLQKSEAALQLFDALTVQLQPLLDGGHGAPQLAGPPVEGLGFGHLLAAGLGQAEQRIRLALQPIAQLHLAQQLPLLLPLLLLPPQGLLEPLLQLLVPLA
ncbi:MAG: NFACT family protein, partial [Vulcanococcus sp.]